MDRVQQLGLSCAWKGLDDQGLGSRLEAWISYRVADEGENAEHQREHREHACERERRRVVARLALAVGG